MSCDHWQVHGIYLCDEHRFLWSCDCGQSTTPAELDDDDRRVLREWVDWLRAGAVGHPPDRGAAYTTTEEA